MSRKSKPKKKDYTYYLVYGRKFTSEKEAQKYAKKIERTRVYGYLRKDGKVTKLGKRFMQEVKKRRKKK